MTEDEIQFKSKGGTYVHIILDLTGNGCEKCNNTVGHPKVTSQALYSPKYITPTQNIVIIRLH